MAWDVRTERIMGLSIDLGAGESAEVPATRVKYRKAGSRGRFESFVVKGRMPADTQKLVDTFEAQRTRRA